MAEGVLARGVSAVLIKLGHRGAYLRTAEGGLAGRKGWERRELYTPVFHVAPDLWTTGAGDSTIAGFLASVVRGLSPEEALTMAVAVGGCCVEAPDATSGVRPWEETVRRVKAGWKRTQARVDESGWKAGPGDLWSGPHNR